jgi:DNA repair photolyase
MRGAASNPSDRFTGRAIEVDLEGLAAAARAAGDDALPSPRTTFWDDASRSIVSTNDSPDLPFEASVNPYRGCEHGCSYCYARPTHEYFGLSAGLDFETKILVKRRAPELLRAALMARSWVPRLVALSGVTDCYQPVERLLGLTRGCLEVLAEFRNPVGIVTKNALVTRDVDVLRRLAEHDAVQPHGVKQLFDEWLAVRRPLRRDKVMDRIRELRGGALNDANFGTRFRGEGEWARQLEALFRMALTRAGLAGMRARGVSTAAFRRPGLQQGGLFEPTA